MKGKNRLVPRLLGITKDSVVRLDERTKEVVKVWPLTSILKWAASPNAFTMVSQVSTRKKIIPQNVILPYINAYVCNTD